MQKDFSDHPLFKEAEARARAWLRPGTGQPSSLHHLMVSPDGKKAVAAALLCEKLEGVASTRLASIDLRSGELEILTQGPRSDSAPRWSPDGQHIAYLSDREQAHINRLRILDVATRTDRATPTVNGFIEYVEWSPDGSRLLLGVAGFGSDLATAQGSTALNYDTRDRPAWAPTVEGVPEAAPWRSLYLYNVTTDAVRALTAPGINIWQAVWCGPNRIGAICSNRPEESHWYSADVRLIEIDNAHARTLFKPADQLGCLAASPSGRSLTVVEAVCSDRNLVAGDLRLIDVETGAVSRPATLGADVVQLHWRDDDKLLFVGARGPATVVGLLDRTSQSSREIWHAEDRTLSGGTIFQEVAPLGPNPADMLFVSESFFEAPTLIAFQSGTERVVRRLGSPDIEADVRRLGSGRDFRWQAPDGLDIHGWILTPPTPGPHPLILHVHGGPVMYTRTTYIARSILSHMMLAAGYAVFHPNPRGSSGRGQPFARHVFGDMGGADTYDYLSGLDALIEAGIADPKRIGVFGGSYGGYMTDWLITQDTRFAAAVAIAPVTDWVSMHLTTYIDTFCETFLNDRIDNPTGKFFTRSPIHFAHRAKTPTLNMCGALDKGTPPGQAIEFHNALRIAGVESVLVTYPLEGHGVRNMPATFDWIGRAMSWFLKHMPVDLHAK